MNYDLTPAEARLVRAVCSSGPLGIAPLGLARVLGVTSATVGNLSVIVERKGFCVRERYGMRVFLRPTPSAFDFVNAVAPEALPTKKTRAPRTPRTR
jgi:DNA-binding MarR family transcriptional regulator